MHPLLLLFALPALTLQAPLDLEAILAKHLHALGGAEALQAHRTHITTSTLQGLAPFDIPVRVEQDREGRYRREVSLQGASQITAFDGRVAWKIDPFTSGPGPVRLEGDERLDLLDQAGFDDELVEAAVKGHHLRYEGTELLPSGPAHRLRLTRADGRTATLYLDATTFLEVRRLQTQVQMGQPTEWEVLSSDYRDVQGVKLAFSIRILPQGAPQGLRIQVKEVAVNAPLDPARFALPHGAPGSLPRPEGVGSKP